MYGKIRLLKSFFLCRRFLGSKDLDSDWSRFYETRSGGNLRIKPNRYCQILLCSCDFVGLKIH
jgi:hypothetical protein